MGNPLNTMLTLYKQFLRPLQAYAKNELSVDYLETSAKDATNVVEAFTRLTEQIKKRSATPTVPPPQYINHCGPNNNNNECIFI